MDGEISPAELRELLADGADVTVVDVRSSAAFRRAHIPGSVNVPFGELTGRIDEIADADRVVTVCPHGQASRQAARLIDSFEGFDGRVDSLAAGIEGWEGDLAVEEGASGEGEDAQEQRDAPF